jgi:sugar phosphate isomerase/epimerase
MAMMLALNQWSLWQELREGAISIPQFIEGAAKRGFKSVELLDYQFDESPDAVEAALGTCRRHGVRVCAYGIRNDFASPFFGEQIRQGNRVKSGLATAQALGARVMRVFGGRVAEGLSFDEAEARMIEALHMAIDWAEPRGIRLALENFGQLCGRTDQILELVRAIGDHGLGVAADLGNFLLVDEKPVESVQRLGTLISHVHLNDFELTEQPPDDVRVLSTPSGLCYMGTTIGKGAADVRGVLAALEKIGYDGYVSLEYEGPLGGWEGVDASLASLQGHLPPMG